MRSVPDVVINADPAQGLQICQADSGGCLSGRRFGGTSMAAPEWAAYAAALNAMLGANLGNANLHFYPLANTNAFHSAGIVGIRLRARRPWIARFSTIADGADRLDARRGQPELSR